MAHFAKLETVSGVANTVTQVVVVQNSDTADASGNEVESIGQAHCQKVLGGTWVQTSYNNNFRVRYSGAGMVYLGGKSGDTANGFIHWPKPHSSWHLHANTLVWTAPTPSPAANATHYYVWDEDNTQWTATEGTNAGG